MPGRGVPDKYMDEAAEQSLRVIDKYFSDQSDDVKAAVVKGVFENWAHNIIPSYILETENY